MRINKHNHKLTRASSWKKYFLALLLFVLCSVGAEPKRAQTPQYVGFFELADCTEIAGWAADKNRLNTSITVSIFDGQTLLQTVLANLPRSDVGAGLGDNGLHGFFMLVPDALKDGQPHSIHVRFESTNVETTNSPKSITCATPVTAPGRTGTGVLLSADLKLNNGAASTTNRVVNLNFSATEVTGASRRDVTSQLTQYRAKEEPDERDSLTDLSTQPWLPIERGSPRLELAERNGFGERYGDRRVAFQVKTVTLESKVVSDVITLAPVVKEYTIHANVDQTQPLIQYAASQGFKFPRSFLQACSGGTGASADPDVATGFAFVSGASLKCGSVSSGSVTCETRFEYELFFERQLNQFWHIKSVNASGGDLKLHGQDRYLLKGHLTAQTPCTSSGCSIKNSDCPSGTVVNPTICACVAPSTVSPTVTIGDIVIEGPAVDDFVDSANPWKNAFVRPQLIIRPPTFQPGIQRPPN